jgi:branched-chain amino acid transport system substrate-binding protein
LRTGRHFLVAGAAAMAVIAVGCSSSSTSSNPPSGVTATSKVYKIGLLTDLTGPASSESKTSVAGAKAGLVRAAADGVKYQLTVADTGTNPSQVLASAQKLVVQDHVDAVISLSAITSLAANYLIAKNIPVVGAPEDGPEWSTAKNFFGSIGAVKPTSVTTTAGEFFKMRGVTALGALGYGISPQSSGAAKGLAASAEHEGVKIAYLNTNFPFGSTNVAPVAIAMKKAGVNGFTAEVDPNTAYALITALDDQGVDLQAAVLPTGYGIDLTLAGPGAVKSAQNTYYFMTFEPVEMQTPATQQFVADLKAVGRVGGDPSYAEYNTYLSVGLLTRAIKATGGDASQASILTALSNIHDWAGMGLFGGHTIDINDRVNDVDGPDNCAWYVQLKGTKFVVVKGAAPLCGTKTGQTVAP